MAAGDASRTWFAEMIAELRTAWREGLDWQSVIALCTRLDDQLQSIRGMRNILPPMMYCHHCKVRQRGGVTHVSVRAMILSLGRFRIVDATGVKELEKGWNKYRAEQSLDRYGNPTSATIDNEQGNSGGEHGHGQFEE